MVMVVATVCVALAAVASGGETKPDIARAAIHNAAGERIGHATLLSHDEKTTVFVSVRGTSRGFHGFHVHERGVCEPPFTSAGGHFNPAGGIHGDHAGDMPPLLVSTTGSATASFTTDRYQVSDLLDVDGSAIIVHAGPDNQPTSRRGTSPRTARRRARMRRRSLRATPVRGSAVGSSRPTPPIADAFRARVPVVWNDDRGRSSAREGWVTGPPQRASFYSPFGGYRRPQLKCLTHPYWARGLGRCCDFPDVRRGL